MRTQPGIRVADVVPDSEDHAGEIRRDACSGCGRESISSIPPPASLGLTRHVAEEVGKVIASYGSHLMSRRRRRGTLEENVVRGEEQIRGACKKHEGVMGACAGLERTWGYVTTGRDTRGTAQTSRNQRAEWCSSGERKLVGGGRCAAGRERIDHVLRNQRARLQQNRPGAVGGVSVRSCSPSAEICCCSFRAVAAGIAGSSRSSWA